MEKQKTPVSRFSERVTSQVGKGKTSRPEFFYKFSNVEYFSSNTIGGGAMKIEMHPVYLWSLSQSVCISYYQTYINKKSKHKPRIIYKYEYIAVECTDGNGGWHSAYRYPSNLRRFYLKEKTAVTATPPAKSLKNQPPQQRRTWPACTAPAQLRYLFPPPSVRDAAEKSPRSFKSGVGGQFEFLRRKIQGGGEYLIKPIRKMVVEGGFRRGETWAMWPYSLI